MAARYYGIPSGSNGFGQTPVSPADPPVNFRRLDHSAHTTLSSRQVSPVRDQPPNHQTYDQRSVSADNAGVGITLGDPSNTGEHRALRDVDQLYGARSHSPSRGLYDPPTQSSRELDTLPPEPRYSHQPAYSQTSIAPLMTLQPPSPRQHTERGIPIGGAGSSGSVPSMPRASYYHGDGYDHFDPQDIADDGDDGLEEQPRQRNGRFAPAAGAGVGAAAAGASLFKPFAGRGASGSYGPVANEQDAEKSGWLAKQNSGNKRLKWIVGSLVAFLIVAAIVGGVVGGVLSRKSSGGSSSSSSVDSDGLWDINSAKVKAVLNNDALHKVFPGMDYTPLNAQYPACLSNPLDQNNVTLDMAILSQLTPAIRLYGTDCNQTEMVLAGIDRLGYNDSMTVWLGVFLGINTTTNVRQIAQMWDILDTNDASRFAGIIIGNEAIFENGMSASDLTTQITSIRSNLTSKGIHLPISTSQLGDDWTKSAGLVTASDIVMSNIHPFFAGTPAEQGAFWAWTFWQNNDVPLTSETGIIDGKTFPKQIISEIGWPSEGGNDCGVSGADNYGCTSDTDGAVASVDNMNTFMDGWVCEALANTTYFWFEAFDEPWKHQFDSTYNHWESKWGLFDMYRNLKAGVNIPDCGGKTADKPY